MADKGQTATFTTIGGNTVTFTYCNTTYGDWACHGCHSSGYDKVAEANEHASVCRAQ
ncbi:hypothetical protein ACGFJC_13010 [Nonomuraea fuscirosea]|uniref:hypothetical protein n=1 Tax=Nonomuraea fuscirosea TaxID=1291556 RepID=UPI00349A507E